MLLCSIADIRARSSSSLEDDALGGLIESVSDDIEAVVGAWLAPRPDDPAAEITLLFDVESTGGTLRLHQGDKRVGIRALTSLSIATTDQPESGGTYTAIPLSSALLRPRPSIEGPADRIVLTSGWFYRGFNSVTATGSFGPAVVSSRVREATISLVLLSMSHTPGVASESIGDYSVGYGAGGDWRQQRDQVLSTLPIVPAL